MKKLVIVGAILISLFGFSSPSMAGIHIGINIPLPPVFAFRAPPELLVIPGTYDVYYSPDVDFNLFFYGGYWYRPYEEYWYRSLNYAGPWVYIGSPPPVLLSLPPDFRIITRGERPIPYWELHRNWRVWQRDRYWEHHHWGRPEHLRHFGMAPSFRERGLGERGFGGFAHRGHAFSRGGGFHGRGEFHAHGGFHPRGGFRGGFHGGGPHGGHGRR